jgi:hypothetical protein
MREWIAEQGGATLWLGVLEQKVDALSFWRRLGYIERERQPCTAPTGFQSTVVLMSCPVNDQP